jgi:hypothetical protein
MVFRPLRSKRSATAFRHRRMVRRERFARSTDGFGDRGFALSYRRIKLVRSPGVAPGSSAWQAESLLLTYDRKHQKEQTPSDLLWPQVFRWRSFKCFRRLVSFKIKKPHSFYRVGLN